MKGFPAYLRLVISTSLASGLISASAFATTQESFLVIPPVNWQAEAPCDAALELDLEDLPGGSLRSLEIQEGPNDRVFKPVSGGRIIIETPEVLTYDLFGETYADVYRDLVARKPLESQAERGSTFAVARIETRVGMTSMTEIRFGPDIEETEARLLEEEFVIRLSPRIWLARWDGYEDANPDQQSLWDRMRCENIHHELGHLFVTAQLFEETIGEALALEAPTSSALSEAISAWFQNTMDRANVRQMRYHREIQKMGVAAANKRPYRELDFPWLDTDAE